MLKQPRPMPDKPSIRSSGSPKAKHLRSSRSLLLGCLFTAASYPALAQTASWTGSAGNNDWFDAGNWDTGLVPDASTDIGMVSGTALISGSSAEGNYVNIDTGAVVTVTGTGSSLSTMETRTSGGILNINDGAVVTNSSGVVGGTVIVSGKDAGGSSSTWTNTDYFVIGDGAAGGLEVRAGGKVNVTADASLGGTYFGTALVSGAGSMWETTGRLSIDNGSLRIEDGGSVSNGLGIIGDTFSAGSVIVTGQGSNWINSDQLAVGSFSSGTMLIEDGATVSSTQGYVGANPGSVGSVTVTGIGSNWQITSSSLTVGNHGVGDITIEDGGLVYAKSGVLLGSSATSASGAVTINGTATARGVLETSFFRGGSGSANITLDGGIVRAIEDKNTFFSNFDGQQLRLAPGGGFFDTNGFSIGIEPEIFGVGELTKLGAGTLTLTGANTYAGGTTITAGTLKLGDGGTSGSIIGDVANDGILAFDRSDVVTFGGTISGAGGVQQLGSGQTTLIANNSALLGTSGVYNGILSVNGSLGGSMQVVGGRLQGTGQLGTTTNFSGGTIAPGNSIGTLTVAGDYIGSGGTLEIETVLGDDSSATDQLVVTGNTSGTTNVRVINLGGAGGQTIEGIKIIEVGGVSAGNFSLLGSYLFKGDPAVVAGAYAYRLYQGGASTPTDGNWYLRSALTGSGGSATPLYQPGAPVYEAYASALQRFNSLDTLQQRVGNRVWNRNTNEVQAAFDEADDSGIWARMTGSHDRMTPKSSTTAADYRVDTWQLQAGSDLELHSGKSGSLVGSLSVHYGTIDSDVTSVFGDGSIRGNGYGFGGSLTWYGEGGFYLDGQTNLTWYDSNLSSSTATTRLVSGNDGFGYALGLEAGQQIVIGRGWAVTPQAQLVYSNVSYKDFDDVFGTKVSLDNDDDLTMRLGLSSDFETTWVSDAGEINRIHAYGIANLYYDALPETRTDVAGVAFTSGHQRLRGGLGIGGTYSWANGKYAIYGEANVKTALRDFSENYSYAGRFGLNIRF
ncbi:autotransporter outer membrane beta-barrel domain-containing protein [Rhizobium rhizogenes]|uniref:autotransporter family protein n=1 Tax=Rhizobium rhizogenes TaxID=359 RepID=UPI0022BA9945|nr:autotransporter outer membrane beta-barrel domain-containing protein [Rhizobium rhizogenes]MCZ7482897.1 autotransporter outer membrane beta-barrel domain-containing protein [Rhizobium rhizogenes]